MHMGLTCAVGGSASTGVVPDILTPRTRKGLWTQRQSPGALLPGAVTSCPRKSAFNHQVLFAPKTPALKAIIKPKFV